MKMVIYLKPTVGFIVIIDLKIVLYMINIRNKNSLIVTRLEQTEVVNKNSKNLNQTKRMFLARVRKRALSGKKSGMLGGGIGVTFGSQKQTTESDQTKLYAQGSQVGTLNGNTTMIAENTYTNR